MNEQRYLGDGVYARYDGYHVVLTANNYDAIFLDPHVLEELWKFSAEINQTLAEQEVDDDGLG